MPSSFGPLASGAADPLSLGADLPGAEASTGLLSRLRRQNSTLEMLRRALDGEEGPATMPEIDLLARV